KVQKKKVAETNKKREACLVCDKERKRYKAGTNANLQQESERSVIAVSIEDLYPAGERASTNLQQESEQPVIGVNIETIYSASENIDTTSQSENVKEISVELQSATRLNEYEKELLRKFRTKMILSGGMCCRCKSKKNLPKKFSGENNMNPGEIPEELQGLTEVEKMLIAQVFTVIPTWVKT
ncbi:15757_t:CDS:2, partial [Gigaspora margarita]